MRRLHHSARLRSCAVVSDSGEGSILLLVLFVCLTLTVVVQALTAVTVCAARELIDESAGRSRMAEKNRGLSPVRHALLHNWAPADWTAIDTGAQPVEASVSHIGGSDLVMEAAVRQDPAISRIIVRAWVERARDGLDLPLAALVAERVIADASRETIWLATDQPEATEVTEASAAPSRPTQAYLMSTPPEEAPETTLIGDDCSIVQMSCQWRLDDGWRAFIAGSASTAGEVSEGSHPAAGPQAAQGSQQAVSESHVVTGPQVVIAEDKPGFLVSLADLLSEREGAGGEASVPGGSAQMPVLVVVIGGADLDARGMGDLYGVIVVDEGGVWLDGTMVRGAVFVTRDVQLGATGTIRFSRPILRWATDRSLQRARLVPGSRWEGTE